MELFEARDHFIIQNGEHALWCNRFDGSLTARRGKKNAFSSACVMSKLLTFVFTDPKHFLKIEIKHVSHYFPKQK